MLWFFFILTFPSLFYRIIKFIIVLIQFVIRSRIKAKKKKERKKWNILQKILVLHAKSYPRIQTLIYSETE